MNILAIESSCDDCGVAIVKDGVDVIVNLVASQEKIHAKFGGVVPEVASREHLRTVFPLVDLALTKAKLKLSDIDAIAVTTGPGLLGSLLVGVHAAKTLAWLWNKPLISVNHLQGHVYSGWLAGEKVEFPVVALVASGGHTEIISMGKHGDYKYLGGTVDDAIGEAFDKTARRLGLGYPGGPAISKEAELAKGPGVELPRPMLKEENYNFSFSGLKTAVTRVEGSRSEIAKGFEDAAVEVVATKLLRAANQIQAKTIIIGGGVAANRRLREVIKILSGENMKVLIPDMKYCTDNAAMIGAAAYFVSSKKKNPGQWYNTEVQI